MPRRGRGAVALLALTGLLARCNAPPTEPPETTAPVRGITFATWSAGGYAASGADASLDALRATGATWVVLLVTAYQATADASALHSADPRTPSAPSVLAAVNRARLLGLRVALKLHVDVDDGTWRALVDPARPAEWFDSYQTFAMEWAAFAEAEQVEMLIFATELAGTLEHADLWQETIAGLRGAYRGTLCYSASWDEAGLVPFWGELDLVGLNAYYPVARTADASRFDLLAGWQPWLARLRLLHAQTDRPILLTELGYRSVNGAGIRPYDFTSDLPLDLEEQADLYWAALEATGDEPWLQGICLWYWPADGTGGPTDRGYSPIGKPAASVLDSAW